MSLLSSSRPTLPSIRDVFRDEFFYRIDPPFNSPSLTLERPWSGDYQEARHLPAQHSGRVVHSIYGPPFRYSDATFWGTPYSPLLHYRRLSGEHIVSLIQPGPSNSFFATSKNAHQEPPQNPLFSNPLFSAKSRHVRSISTSTTDTEDAEAFEPMQVARYNRDESLASTRSPSFTHEVRHERRNSPASYECPYCGKVFNRPSSLKIHSNSHTGKKPFACPVQDCGRSFSVLSNMRRHARAHSSYARLTWASRPQYSRIAHSSASGSRRTSVKSLNTLRGICGCFKFAALGLSMICRIQGEGPLQCRSLTDIWLSAGQVLRYE